MPNKQTEYERVKIVEVDPLLHEPRVSYVATKEDALVLMRAWKEGLEDAGRAVSSRMFADKYEYLCPDGRSITAIPLAAMPPIT